MKHRRSTKLCQSLAAALALCVTAPALSLSAQEAQPAPAPAQPAEAKVATPAKPTEAKVTPPAARVKLLSAGAAPRRVLQYAFRAGETAKAQIDMTASVGMKSGGQEMPAVTMPTIRYLIALGPIKKTAGGFLVPWHAASVKVTGDANPEAAKAIEPVLGYLRKMKGTYVMRPNGEVGATTLDLPADAPAQLSSQAQGFQSNLGQLTSQFPAEPIGVGAKWQVATDVPADEVTMHQTVTYELKTLTKKGGALDVQIDAPSGGVSVLYLPPRDYADPPRVGVSASGACSKETSSRRLRWWSAIRRLVIASSHAGTLPASGLKLCRLRQAEIKTVWVTSSASAAVGNERRATV